MTGVYKHRRGALTLAAGALYLLAAAPVHAQCVGDCDGDGMVSISNLILGVNIALDSQPVSACEAFANAEHQVTISQLIQGVNNALAGCPATPTATMPGVSTPTNTSGPGTPTNTSGPGTPTNTPVSSTPTDTPVSSTPTNTVGADTPTASPSSTVQPTPTETAGPQCPLAAGAYTVTQVTGGKLAVYGFAPFPFPAGGSIVQDVKAASLPDCVHDVVVSASGGFTAPNFCVPALNLTTSVTQTGCGVGKLDSNGGSDFDTNEVGDTSDTTGPCNLPHPSCTAGANSSLRVDITVGNGAPDSCVSGTVNALITVPVHTKSWSDMSGGTFNGCPGDGVFNGTDTVVAEFDQILDFTTASGAGKWMDLDGDGCSLAGLGPASGYTDTGTCMDATKLNTAEVAVITVATGEFGSTGGTFDGSFSTNLPNTVSGPAAPLGATCATAPVINYSGMATRCIP